MCLYARALFRTEAAAELGYSTPLRCMRLIRYSLYNLILILAGAIRSQFGQGAGPILLDEVQCTGNETRLVDCGHNGISTHDCSNTQDAGVICQSK